MSDVYVVLSLTRLQRRIRCASEREVAPVERDEGEVLAAPLGRRPPRARVRCRRSQRRDEAADETETVARPEMRKKRTGESRRGARHGAGNAGSVERPARAATRRSPVDTKEANLPSAESTAHTPTRSRRNRTGIEGRLTMRKVALDLGSRQISFCEVSDGKVLSRRSVRQVSELESVLGPDSDSAVVAIEACREAWHVRACSTCTEHGACGSALKTWTTGPSASSKPPRKWRAV